MIDPKGERDRQQGLRNALARRVADVPPQFPGADPPPALVQYVVKKHENDYLVCRTWDGETEGDTDVLIALMYELRRTVWDFALNGGRTRTNKDGDRIKYNYIGGKHWEREAEIVESEAIEDQIIVRSYVTEARTSKKIGPDVIIASRLDSPVTVTVDEESVKLYLIHKTSREFATKFDDDE